VALAIFQRPGTNALAAADEIQAAMERLSARLPARARLQVVYNPTEFISEAMNEVYKTLILEAVILVVIVIIVFLQNRGARRSSRSSRSRCP
jgi:HAE1 family hydrophobic/amphiphilic exporter-1